MTIAEDIDYGTPAEPLARTGDASRSTASPVTVPAGTSVMRAAAEAGVAIPKLCATDRLDAFGSCRLCVVDIDGRKGTPASCTTPCDDGMVVHTQTPHVAKLRRGVMELYISDHPLDCLTCPANGDCELQDMAGVVGLREVRYGFDGENHLERPEGRVQPLLHLRRQQVHRLQPLRAGLRRGPGHLRADDRRPRLRLEGQRRAPTRPSSTASASPAAPASRPARRPPSRRSPSSSSACRRARSRRPAPTAASAARSTPSCAATSSCAWCPTRPAAPTPATPASRAASPGATPRHPDRVTRAHGPRRDHRPVARGRRGTRRSPSPPRGSSAIQAEHGVDAIGGITSSRCTNEEVYVVQKMIRAAFGNNNVDTCARVCHSPTGYGLKQTFGTSAGTQDFASVEDVRPDRGDRGEPHRRPPGLRLAHEAPAARRAPSSS